MGHVKSSAQWQHSLWIIIYTLILLICQAIWISRLPYRALRADLLLPLMLGIAIEWPAAASLSWAFLCGFAVDTLSGKFWGFHVGSYVVAICLVNVAAEKFEFRNPFYQMSFVGLCSLGQSVALGLFLLLEPATMFDSALTWESLAIRSVFMMLLAPFINHPVWKTRKTAV